MIVLQTFGFKYGLPNTNYYFDVSFIANPVRQPGKSLHDRYDDSILKFVEEQPGVEELVTIIAQLAYLVNNYDDGVRIGIGCSAGRHRSRAVAQLVAQRLSDLEVKIVHREDSYLI